VPNLTNAGVLVTGAGRGIGKRLAIGFAGAGNRVGLLARSKAELDLAHLEIEHAGGNALRIRADVTDFEQVSAAVDRMRVHYGEVQVLICAAAVPGAVGPFVEQSPKVWVETVHTNLLGVMHACRAVLPHMVERRSGKIVVLSGAGSTAWWRPSPRRSATTTSRSTAWNQAPPTPT
jgi:3-oxoacyl-[acyl-carrier protein] reductase